MITALIATIGTILGGLGSAIVGIYKNKCEIKTIQQSIDNNITKGYDLAINSLREHFQKQYDLQQLEISDLRNQIEELKQLKCYCLDCNLRMK